MFPSGVNIFLSVLYSDVGVGAGGWGLGEEVSLTLA